MPEIEIKNVGPIEEFRYDMAEPGLHVLVGQQGSGKSTTLRTVELAVQGDTTIKPIKRDGSKSGEATVAGKTLKISRTTREEGELSVEGLGDLDLSSLHWPKFEKPAIRDKTRIATLCRLAGLKGSVDDFKAILGEEDWNTLVGPNVTITDDVVELAGRIKRAIDSAALTVEKAAEIAEANAVAQTKLFEGIELSDPSDEQQLSAAYSAAVAKHQQLQAAHRASEAANAGIEAARKSLAAIPAVNVAAVERDTEADVVASETEHLAAIRETERARNSVELAKKMLAEALVELDRASHGEVKAFDAVSLMKQSAKEQVEAARQAMEQRKLHEMELGKASVEGPTLDELANSDLNVDAAQAAMMHGQRVRAALAAKAEHESHTKNAKALAAKARKLREAAKAALGVLGDAIEKIPGCPLKVVSNEDGETRLVIGSDRSKEEYFDELSDGERWKVIVPLTLKPDRLIVLPQAAFGEMAPSTAAMLDGLIRDQRAYVLTARADDVPLQGMSYRDWFRAVSNGDWETYSEIVRAGGSTKEFANTSLSLPETAL